MEYSCGVIAYKYEQGVLKVMLTHPGGRGVFLKGTRKMVKLILKRLVESLRKKQGSPYSLIQFV